MWFLLHKLLLHKWSYSELIIPHFLNQSIISIFIVYWVLNIRLDTEELLHLTFVYYSETDPGINGRMVGYICLCVK